MNMKIKYDRNKPYNLLPELPPQKDFLDTEVLLRWGMASRNLAELNKNVLRIPNPSMLVNTITIREAKTSAEIENIFTTDDELYKALSTQQEEEKVDASTKEVLSYREALWDGYQSIQENGQITEEVIISVFQRIKNTTLGIRPPQSQTVIKRGNSEFRSGEVIYTPPRGEKIIQEKLENLLKFMNEENGIDPLLKMAIAHYQFEAIHPFVDGNGRTGRIINLLYLVHQELISHPVLYLSRYIIQNKEDYYHLLLAVTQRGDWKSWLVYMMKAVEQTAKYTNQLIDQILAQKEATLSYAKEKLKWYTVELNDQLFAQPYIKQQKIGEILQVNSRTTLVKYAEQLNTLGILSTRREGKEVFYVNDDLLRILQD
jgi:Fic family protein